MAGDTDGDEHATVTAASTSADKILKEWDDAGITDFIYNMYERYHSEELQNAFTDIDSLLTAKKK